MPILVHTDVVLDRKITRPDKYGKQLKINTAVSSELFTDAKVIWRQPFTVEPWTRIDTSSLFKDEPPAKPHPLQLLSEQPSAFGQSMWRPWEK